LRGERHAVRPPHLHLCSGDPPLGIGQVEFGPFGISEFARSHKDEGREFQGIAGRGVPSKPSMTRSKAPTALGSTIVARWVTVGVIRAPRRSPVGSRSARAAAMANRNTAPTVLRTRVAVSCRPRCSIFSGRPRFSGALSSAIGCLPLLVGEVQ
jgi:hypothetical protein